mgnify:CR=1 FL=1
MQLFMVSFYNGEWYEDSDWYTIGVFSTQFDADMHGIGYVATKKDEFKDCKYDVQEITLDEGWCP